MADYIQDDGACTFDTAAKASKLTKRTHDRWLSAHSNEPPRIYIHSTQQSIIFFFRPMDYSG